MKVFLSHQMSGLSKEEVMEIRNTALNNLQNKFGAIELIDNYHHEDAPKEAGRLWHLGTSIRMMEQADLIYFCAGWKNAKGCLIERQICDIYSLKRKTILKHKLGIHINTKKTRIVKLCSSYKFLQVKYEMTEDGKLYKKINPKRVVCFRRKIKKLAIKVLEGTSTYENVENTFKSWMGAYYKLLTKVQRENLITLYEDLFNKRIDIVNKKMVITNKE